MKPELQTRLEKLEQSALKLAWILAMTIGFVLILTAYISQEM